MLKISSIIIFMAFSVSSFAQGDIDFAPGALLKTLNIDSKEELTELPLTGGQEASGRFYRVNSKEMDSPVFAYIGRVHSCRAGGCSAVSDAAMGFEYFDYFIVFNQNFEVQSVKVYNYQATKGHEITAKNWLKQFVGYKGEKTLEVGKEIDSISGATVSAYAITADIEYRVQLLRSFL